MICCPRQTVPIGAVIGTLIGRGRIEALEKAVVYVRILFLKGVPPFPEQSVDLFISLFCTFYGFILAIFNEQLLSFVKDIPNLVWIYGVKRLSQAAKEFMLIKPSPPTRKPLSEYLRTQTSITHPAIQAHRDRKNGYSLFPLSLPFYILRQI